MYPENVEFQIFKNFQKCLKKNHSKFQNFRSILRHFKPLEANSDAESNASDSSNDSNDSSSLSEASVKTSDDSEDGSEDSGRNFGLKLIEL